MIVMIINYMVLIYIELLRIKGHGVVYSKTQLHVYCWMA